MKASQLQIRMKKKIGHAQADEGHALGPDGRLGQVRHLLDQRLPEQLQLARDPRRDLGPHAQSETQHDGGGDERGPHDVQVDGETRHMHHAVVLADRDVADGEARSGSLDPLRHDAPAPR